MKVEQQKITKLVISDVENHDPIHVYLEDEGDNRRGRVTISESGESWSCSWGGMGLSLVELILYISNEYWIEKLAPQLKKSIDSDNDANIEFAKNKVIEVRKKDEIDKFRARDYWGLIESSNDVKRDCCDYYMGSELLNLFSDDAYYESWPIVDNPEYLRMESRLNAAREAIKQIQEG